MEENNNQYQPQPGQTPPNPAPYYQPPIPAYQAPSYQNPVTYEDNTPLSIGNYLVMMIVSAIPLVGLIMTLIWAFGSSTNKNKQNYARAMLILMLIGIVLSIIFGASIIAAAASLGNMY